MNQAAGTGHCESPTWRRNYIALFSETAAMAADSHHHSARSSSRNCMALYVMYGVLCALLWHFVALCVLVRVEFPPWSMPLVDPSHSLPKPFEFCHMRAGGLSWAVRASVYQA